MTGRSYGQYCGLARALDLVGERWALLIVRDLLSGPRRFSQLQATLAGIPSNVLTNRLKELELAGVVRREVVPAPGRGTVYVLTEDGRALEPTLIALGRWGAGRLGEPAPGEVVTAESFAMALRTTYRPEVGRRLRRTVRIEVHLGDLAVTADISGADLDVRTGTAEDEPPGGPGNAAGGRASTRREPDLVVHAGPAIKAVMAGEMTPAEAEAAGVARVEGDEALWGRFGELFRI